MGGPNKFDSDRWLESRVGVDGDESGKAVAARATTTMPTPTKRAMPVEDSLTVFPLGHFDVIEQLALGFAVALVPGGFRAWPAECVVQPEEER